MPLLGFKAQFSDLVRSGVKRQTIRAPRKHLIKPGDKLFLYTGLRTKQAEKLGEHICKEVFPILINTNTKHVYIGDWDRDTISTSAENIMSEQAVLQLAVNDGFKSVDDFFSFFRRNGENVFVGYLIKW